MKLRNRIIAILSTVALVVVGFAVPAAVAGGGGGNGNTNHADYWLNKYDNAVACYKTDKKNASPHGEVVKDAEGHWGVKLKPFQQSWDGDRWEVLIVKGGNGYNEVSLPNANEVYNPPKNGGKNYPDVSHWIVCKGSQEKPSYNAPDCKNLHVKFPGSANGQHVNIKLSPRGADADKGVVTLNFHNDHNTWSNPLTLDYTKHKDFPSWAQWAVVWVQVAGQSYHWEGNVKCGEPEPQKHVICKWDAKHDEAKQVEVESLEPGMTKWVDGRECTPELVTICVKDGWKYTWMDVFDDGKTGYRAVKDSKCEVPEVVCENLGNSPFVPKGVTIVDPQNGKDCYYKVYVCWELRDYVDDFTSKPGSEELFPQDYVTHAANWQDVKDHCGNIVPACEEIRQFQTDYYFIDTAYKAERLETLMTQGYLTYGKHSGGPDDGILLQDPHNHWTLIEVVGKDCKPVYDYYCVWDSGKGKASKEKVEEGINPPDDGRTWTAWTKKGLRGCTPPKVSICAFGDNGWEKSKVYEDALPAEYTLWTGDARDCFDVEGTVNVCHGKDSNKHPFTAFEVDYHATFNGTEWEFDFEGRHGTNKGRHGADIIPPFTHEENGEFVNFPGKNWPSEFEGTEGWSAWLDYWANDCETPVDTAVNYDSWGGVCEAPNGGYTYTATVGSFEAKHRFFITAAGEDAQLLGTVKPGGTKTFSNNDLPPGDYTIHAEPFVVLASPMVVETWTAADIGSQFTYEFTIDSPTGCADILPTFLGGVCEADAPFLEFTIVLNDPYGETTFPQRGQFEFLNTKNGDGNTTIDLWLRTDASVYTEGGVGYSYSHTGTEHTWAGQVLWPGSAIDGDGNPTHWPGWETHADGTFTNVGLSNFGWTRDGVDISVSVNPSVTVSGVDYPAATPVCDSPPTQDESPSDEFTIVAGALPLPAAGPAVPVTAVASFAG